MAVGARHRTEAAVKRQKTDPAVPIKLAACGLILLTLLTLVLSACASGPPPADWQLNARSSMDRSITAYLAGDTRVANLEFARARAEIASTGRLDLLARAELLRCAAQVASLVGGPCAEFDKLKLDAAAPEQAYADYLTGRLRPQDIALLPASQRAVAAPGLDGATAAVALNAITDPLSRLVAAGVLMQAGKSAPTVVALAVDTASGQGWRRPLLAWLALQTRQAELAGHTAEAERLRRRMAAILAPT